jgi:hypothetical protein
MSMIRGKIANSVLEMQMVESVGEKQQFELL